ncbi:MAG: ParB/RepB/Spo0J family partition protein [Phycisphaeraceae bacterium]|nr:ParB/RepB/Spo0J family partition protein [Phycisphaeraceae bacterium]
MSDKIKKRTPRLGRGLSSLIATPVQVQPPEATKLAKSSESHETGPVTATKLGSPATIEAAGGRQQGGDGLQYVLLEAIAPNPHQPRQHFEQAAIESLADSIRRDGLMQPIVLRPAPPEIENSKLDGRNSGEAAPTRNSKLLYQIVAGERRWRAARLAGLERIPAVVRELDEQTATEWTLIENLQREDLNPIERAEAFRNLAEQYHLSHEQIAKRVGLDRATVTNLLRLLSLSQSVRELVRQELLSMGQARAIAGLNSAQAQEALASRAVREGLSVRQVERLARALAGDAVAAGPGKMPKGAIAGKSAYFRDLEKQISQQLGTRVHLNPSRKKGAGRLTIEFYSLDEFDAIMNRLGVQVT